MLFSGLPSACSSILLPGGTFYSLVNLNSRWQLLKDTGIFLNRFHKPIKSGMRFKKSTPNIPGYTITALFGHFLSRKLNISRIWNKSRIVITNLITIGSIGNLNATSLKIKIPAYAGMTTYLFEPKPINFQSPGGNLSFQIRLKRPDSFFRLMIHGGILHGHRYLKYALQQQAF